jgi:hypothetical protein
MAQAGTLATKRFWELLTAETGLNTALSILGQGDEFELASIVLPERQVLTQHIAADLEEKTTGSRYPSFHIYCEQISNTLQEKFRTFSGTVRLVADVRVSQDRVENIGNLLHRYVDGLTFVLDNNRGDWGKGMHYGGGYDVAFLPVKHGGKNFLQSAKITFIVNASW